MSEYKALAASGAKHFGVGEVGVSFPASGSRSGHERTWTVPNGYVSSWVERLEPAMSQLSALGLLDKIYVYGFE